MIFSIKRLLPVFVAGAAFCTVSASAAPKAVPQAYNWSGFYLGGHLGYARQNVRWTDEANDWFDGSKTFSSHGFAGGAVAGLNFQSGAFVYGIEADIGKTTNKDVSRPTDYDGVVTNKVDWIATVRGRAGIASDRTLIFATAGYAHADFSAFMTSNTYPTETFGEIVGSKNGWVWGGGIEYALSGNWLVSGQILAHRFGHDRAEQKSDPGQFMRVDRQSVVTARVGLSFKFNSGMN